MKDSKEITPQEKAKELVEKFTSFKVMLLYKNQADGDTFPNTFVEEKMLIKSAKKCAIILCDEMLSTDEIFDSTPAVYFWQQVKEDINNLE